MTQCWRGKVIGLKHWIILFLGALSYSFPKMRRKLNKFYYLSHFLNFGKFFRVPLTCNGSLILELGTLNNHVHRFKKAFFLSNLVLADSSTMNPLVLDGNQLFALTRWLHNPLGHFLIPPNWPSPWTTPTTQSILHFAHSVGGRVAYDMYVFG